ncbi:MAG: fibrobacter succinogenes major paralogous domain-containing protein [Crocinitomicaceae bacterium]|nr:fibrobacter succinogenes major paralogous domain-containing protein [Crocinitomicaceae bacterium]
MHLTVPSVYKRCFILRLLANAIFVTSCALSDDLFAQVVISTTNADPHPSSALDVNFDNRGFLPPRLTSEQRDLINDPAPGLQIYNVETNCINYFNGTSWFEVCGNCLPGPPQEPTGIQGSNALLAGSSGHIFSVDPVAGATTYLWSVPEGWSIESGQYSPTIEITAGNSGQNGNISVSAGNACGYGPLAQIAVTASVCFGDTFSDSRDNSSYTTIEIGSQCWMKENLRYLPSVSNMSNTGSTTNPHFYVYAYNGTSVATAKTQANYITYGTIYNLPAALTACPSGWHLPSDNEWKEMEMAIGMSAADANATDWRGTNEGTKLKNEVWNGNNASGMTMLPGGRRYPSGAYITYGIGTWSYWWTATEEVPGSTWVRRLESSNTHIWRASLGPDYGLYIRCVRN